MPSLVKVFCEGNLFESVDHVFTEGVHNLDFKGCAVVQGDGGVGIVPYEPSDFKSECVAIAVFVKEESDRSVFSLFLRSSLHGVSTMIILFYIQISRPNYWARAHAEALSGQIENKYLQVYA